MSIMPYVYKERKRESKAMLLGMILLSLTLALAGLKKIHESCSFQLLSISILDRGSIIIEVSGLMLLFYGGYQKTKHDPVKKRRSLILISFMLFLVLLTILLILYAIYG